MGRIIKRSKKPGSFYFANTWHCGVRLRDCLKTSDRREAQRRLTELEISVERGEYQKGNIKFEQLVAGYEPPTKRKESIVKTHLLPAFRGQRVWDLDIPAFLEKISFEQSQSSMGQIFGVMREIGLEFKGISSKKISRRSGIEQKITAEQFDNFFDNCVPKRYRAICLVAYYSMLRLNDILKLRKMDVDFSKDKKGEYQGGITCVPSKTRKKNPKTCLSPMSVSLHEAFLSIGIHPLRNDDLWFLEFKAINVSAGIKRAFKKTDMPWASFHQFRRFGATYLRKNGMEIEAVSKILHHKKISTTQIYIETTASELIKGVSVFDKSRTQVGHKQDVK